MSLNRGMNNGGSAHTCMYTVQVKFLFHGSYQTKTHKYDNCLVGRFPDLDPLCVTSKAANCQSALKFQRLIALVGIKLQNVACLFK